MMQVTSAVRLLMLAFLAGTLSGRAQTPVGLGWACNNVNGAIFSQKPGRDPAQKQYTAYYDSVGYVVLAKRRLPAGPWQVQRTQYQRNVKDAHNVISLMVDGAGYVHPSFDRHGNPLRYCRGTAPGSLTMSALQPMDRPAGATRDLPRVSLLSRRRLAFSAPRW